MGTISNPFTKQLYLLQEEWLDELKKFAEGKADFQTIINNSELKSHFLKMAKRLELLKEILWFEIKSELELWDVPALGIRKGWKVVLIDKKEEENKGSLIIGPFPFPFPASE